VFFPNETTLINGTILGLPNSTHHNTTIVLPNSTSTNNHPIPDNGTSAINGPSIIVGTNRDSNSGATAKSTTAALNTDSTKHLSASVLVSAIFVPLCSLVLISVILYIARSSWNKRKARKSRQTSLGHSDLSDFRSNGQFENKRTDTRGPDTVVPLEPAYKAWISPQLSKAQYAQPSNHQTSHWSTISLNDDHQRGMSPISAYVPSIHDPSRSPRRSSMVSSLDYNISHPNLPSPKDRQGRFMSSNLN